MLICSEPFGGVIYWCAKLHSHLYGHINLSDAGVGFVFLRVARRVQWSMACLPIFSLLPDDIVALYKLQIIGLSND